VLLAHGGVAETSGAFGFGGPTCGLGNGWSWEIGDESREFPLCLALPAAAPWDRTLAHLRPAPLPGEPLRGVRNSSASFGTKFLRGTIIITGTEIVSGVILAVLPKQYTKWDDDALRRGGSNFGRAYTELPVWDGDAVFHNWIGHPYAGAFYYNMLRSQGATVVQSFGFAAFQTVMWEYVLESVAEQPSIQDLITTSIIGSVLGELFNRWSVAILRKGHLNFGQKALVFFLNPSYVINNGYRPPQ
jgi:hypothetical protein